MRKLGVVGLGIGSAFFDVVKQMEGVSIGAICDISSERLGKVAEEQGIRDTYTSLDDMLRAAESHLDSQLQLTRERVEGTRLRLESLNPADTLRRGYAIVERKDSGAAVTDADDVAPDDVVSVRVSRGSFDATVVD